MLLALSAAAQNIANWNTTSGNWNNANNWDCVVNGSSQPCVPGAGFNVQNIGGDITLDIDTSIAHLAANGGSLTLSGKALTATDPLGIQMTLGIVNMSNTSVINGFLLAQTLHVDSSTVNGSVQTFDATVTNGKLGALTLSNRITAANSTFGSSSSVTIAQNSSLANSTIGGQFVINSGTLTVDSGSTINATQTLITTGGLTIQGGSTWNASTQPVFLGLGFGSSSVDVTGTGSTLNITNTALELGQIGNATVTVEHGGTIAATGSGGNFLIGLGVVFPTQSSMLVQSGGQASANKITVSGAGAVGSSGLLSISDSSSNVTTADELLVINGGVVNAANQSSLTANSLRIQTSGSVTIDSGATLTLASDTVALVGSVGAGTLTFQNGGTGSGPGQLVLGGSAGSSGTVVITGSGSSWQSANSISVGEAGTGSLTVSEGGSLDTGADTNGLSASIGTKSTGIGTVTLNSGDWVASGTLMIGNAGTGTLSLLEGATAVTGAAVLGASAGSSGSVSVSGTGSTWTNSGKLTVGSSGSGLLLISDGGVVSNVDAVIGDKKGSSGSVMVIGAGSTWHNGGILTIGGDGGASLTIDGGTVTAGGAGIGSNFASVHVDVTNQGSLTILGDVTIGGAGQTDVTIENGATFDSDHAASIGGSGGDTTVTVTGAGSSWTIHGTGALTIDDKGSLFVTDGGTLTAGTITLLSGGLLNGQGGTIIGNIVNSGATMTAGDATGTLTITGNYTQTSGELLFEIDGLGPTQFDRMVISGLANITGGSIDIIFGNGFTPAAGETFDLLSAALGITITGVTFDVIGLPPGLRFFDSIGANGFTFGFASDTASAPEPAGVMLFAMGLGVLIARSRRLLGRGARTKRLH
jgi:fibronectin-binding autotransporter adhesin